MRTSILVLLLAGARLVSHIFHNMPPFRHRDPGPIGLLAEGSRGANDDDAGANGSNGHAGANGNGNGNGANGNGNGNGHATDGGPATGAMPYPALCAAALPHRQAAAAACAVLPCCTPGASHSGARVAACLYL